MAKKRVSAKEQERYTNILQALKVAYPDAKPGLDFTNPFELLIATILSAQCTDKQVNKVTPVGRLIMLRDTRQKLPRVQPAPPAVKQVVPHRHNVLQHRIAAGCHQQEHAQIDPGQIFSVLFRFQSHGFRIHNTAPYMRPSTAAGARIPAYPPDIRGYPAQ